MCSRLCAKAKQPLRPDMLEALGVADQDITVAAVCVYPSRVRDAVEALQGTDIPVASVATGFPAGQTPLPQRVAEIEQAIEAGAAEIDVVINRTHVLTGDWTALYEELRLFRAVCGDSAHMKTILATGDLGTLKQIYQASLVAMMAGSDFIKTSTGKESVNATLEFSLVMTRAIREYQTRTGFKVGFKPAGGISKAKQAMAWQALMKEELGVPWLMPDLFRFGASSLLDRSRTPAISLPHRPLCRAAPHADGLTGRTLHRNTLSGTGAKDELNGDFQDDGLWTGA